MTVRYSRRDCWKRIFDQIPKVDFQFRKDVKITTLWSDFPKGNKWFDQITVKRWNKQVRTDTALCSISYGFPLPRHQQKFWNSITRFQISSIKLLSFFQLDTRKCFAAFYIWSLLLGINSTEFSIHIILLLLHSHILFALDSIDSIAQTAQQTLLLLTAAIPSNESNITDVLIFEPGVEVELLISTSCLVVNKVIDSTCGRSSKFKAFWWANQLPVDR